MMRSCFLVVLVSLLSRRVAGQSCSICPSGSSIEDGNKLLIDKTCGDREASVSAFVPGSANCDAAVAAINDEFDVTAYCCAGVDPPQTCDVCANVDGLLTNPNVVLPNSPNTTCAEVGALADYILKTTSCDSVQERAAPSCCFDFVCKLCPTDLLLGQGGEITEPNKLLPSNEEGLACSDLDVLIRKAPRATCSATLQELNKDLDYARYCGCEGLDEAPTCDFCGELPLKDPTVVIPEQDGITCQYANDVAPFIVNQDNCTSLAEDRELCCDFTNPVCELCPNGQTFSNPNRMTFLDPNNNAQTCQDYDTDVFQVSYVTGASCSTFRNALKTDFLIDAYCGCPNTSPPANPVCPLCNSETETVNDSVFIPGMSTTTCQALAEFARYVKDDAICFQRVEKHQDLCCTAKTVVDDMPSDPAPLTTDTPTAAPDDSGAAAMVATWTASILLGAVGMALL